MECMKYEMRMNGRRKIILKFEFIFITNRYKWKRIDKCHLALWSFV